MYKSITNIFAQRKPGQHIYSPVSNRLTRDGDDNRRSIVPAGRLKTGSPLCWSLDTAPRPEIQHAHHSFRLAVRPFWVEVVLLPPPHNGNCLAAPSTIDAVNACSIEVMTIVSGYWKRSFEVDANAGGKDVGRMVGNEFQMNCVYAKNLGNCQFEKKRGEKWMKITLECEERACLESILDRIKCRRV